MKKIFSVMWPALVTFLFVFTFLWIAGTAAIAQDQCDVVGNSYALTIDGDGWTLTDFVETGPFFSPAPRCAGTVSLVSPDGEPVDCDWMVCHGNLMVAGYPAVLTSNELKIYGVPTGLHTLRIGGTFYMTEKEIPLFLFK
jgi:hypothetical protein